MTNTTFAISYRNGFFAAFLIGALSISSGSYAQDNAALPRPAKLIDIIAKDPVQKLTLPAIVQPGISVDLTVQVGGVLTEFPVQQGQRVKTGDLIAQIDKTEFQNAVDQAQAQFDNVQEEFGRAEKLIAQDLIARAVFDKRKATRDIAGLALAAAKTQLGETTLVAPFDGVVSQTNVKQYQTIGPQSPVITLQGYSEFEALANVPAQTVASSSDFEVEETVLILDVAPLRKIPLTFKLIAPQADPASQTFEIRFSFVPPDDLVVLSGMTGELRVTIRQIGELAEKTAIQVPVSAILYDGSETYVWIVDTTAMTVARRAVTIGEGIGETLAVTKGLGIGDTIVGAGASYLHDGMKIRRFGQ